MEAVNANEFPVSNSCPTEERPENEARSAQIPPSPRRSVLVSAAQIRLHPNVAAFIPFSIRDVVDSQYKTVTPMIKGFGPVSGAMSGTLYPLPVYTHLSFCSPVVEPVNQERTTRTNESDRELEKNGFESRSKRPANDDLSREGKNRRKDEADIIACEEKNIARNATIGDVVFIQGNAKKKNSRCVPFLPQSLLLHPTEEEPTTVPSQSEPGDSNRHTKTTEQVNPPTVSTTQLSGLPTTNAAVVSSPLPLDTTRTCHRFSDSDHSADPVFGALPTFETLPSIEGVLEIHLARCSDYLFGRNVGYNFFNYVPESASALRLPHWSPWGEHKRNTTTERNCNVGVVAEKRGRERGGKRITPNCSVDSVLRSIQSRQYFNHLPEIAADAVPLYGFDAEVLNAIDVCPFVDLYEAYPSLTTRLITGDTECKGTKQFNSLPPALSGSSYGERNLVRDWRLRTRTSPDAVGPHAPLPVTLSIADDECNWEESTLSLGDCKNEQNTRSSLIRRRQPKWGEGLNEDYVRLVENIRVNQLSQGTDWFP